jgi:hypothetical protein
MQSKTYRVTFERIGRNHAVPPLTTAATGADDLAEQIHSYARPHLRSHDYAVEVDLGEGKGFIAAGFHSGGNFTIATVEQS